MAITKRTRKPSALYSDVEVDGVDEGKDEDNEEDEDGEEED
jgi:hypothetical protein